MVKIDVKVSRKTLLLLNCVIEGGVDKNQLYAQELLNLVPKEDVQQLKDLAP